MRRFFLALIAAPVFYILAGFVGAIVPGPKASVNGAPTELVGLARGPIHYDLLLPLTPDTRQAFAFAAEQGLPMDHPQAQWLVAGWGSAGFYTTVGRYFDVEPGVLWRAATGDTAVIRLDLAGDVSAVPSVQWLEVSAAQIAALRQTVLASLERDSADRPIAVAPADWGQGHVFYRALGRFHLFQTCNAWLGETLRAAGIAQGVWTPTTQALALSLWWHRS